MANPTYRSEAARIGIRAARAARADLGLDLESPLPDVLTAAERLGPPVAVIDLVDGIAGAYLVRPGGRIVFVNRTHAVQRQRFTLAHELGHHRLDHPGQLDHPKDLGVFSGDSLEGQANWFAAEFLIPMAAARHWVATELDGRRAELEDVLRFACTFGVSAKAACIRLETAGRLTPDDHAQALHKRIDDCEHYGMAEELELVFIEDELAAIKGRGPRVAPGLGARLRAGT